MRKVSVGEAAKQLSALLDFVARGKAVVIVRRGKPVARLVPVANAEEVAAVIARMKVARQSRGSMSRAEILTARDEGRL